MPQSKAWFGEFDPINWKLPHKSYLASFSRRTQGILYENPNQEESSQIIPKNQNILVQPVEPLHLPKPLAELIYIEMPQPIWLMANQSGEYHLTMPLEIGLLLPSGKTWELIDVFSFAKQKMTLSDSPGVGQLCKYWKSSFIDEPEKHHSLETGWLKLSLNNQSNRSIKVTHLVTNAYQLKIYYGPQKAYLNLKMDVRDKKNAEISCIDHPPSGTWQKAIELYPERKMLGMGSVFKMEGSF